MVPIDSPWVIWYSTFIDSIIVSVIILKYFTCNFDYSKLAQLKEIQSQCHGANWKPIGGFLYEFHCVGHFVSHGILDI